MIKVQCDKNLNSIFKRFLNSLKIPVETMEFSDFHADISVVRSSDDIKSVSADYIIINSDDKELSRLLSAPKSKIITCGFSSRSTVTISSITENECVLCLQRSLKSISGKKISPFELPIRLCGIKFDDVSVIMMITAALLCDVSASKLNKIEL